AGISSNGGSLLIENSSFLSNNNNGSGGGGAIAFNGTVNTNPPPGTTDAVPGFVDGALLIRNCRFTNNSSAGSGGAIELAGSFVGPTPVLPFASTSPLINAGSNALIPDSTDQRGAGYARISDGIVDIGAFERQPYVVTSANDSGTGSLRDAMTFTNNDTAPDEI